MKGTIGIDYIVGFTVRLGTGAPATGIAPGDFIPRVRCLDTGVDDGSVPNVIEIGHGRYAMLIRAAFTTAEGIGNYLWSVEVDSAAPLVRDIESGVVEFDVPVAATVWDELLTGTTHNLKNSAGKKLREIFGGFVVHDGQAQAGTDNTITLDALASAIDGQYDPALITIVDGTGVGQTRLILEYNGASKVAVLDRDWRTNPDASSEYLITANSGHEHVNEGLARSGSTSSTIKLNALASSVSNFYVGQHVFLKSGTGQDQTRLITAYDGSTKIATVSPDWCTTPDATTAYAMLPFGKTSILPSEVWSADLTGYTDEDQAGGMMNWNYRLGFHRQEVDFALSRLVLYDKAGTNVIGYFALTDGDGNAVQKAIGSPARRGKFV